MKASDNQPMTPGSVAPNKKVYDPHLVDWSRLRDRSESLVVCTCGERVVRENANKVAAGFSRHRREMELLGTGKVTLEQIRECPTFSLYLKHFDSAEHSAEMKKLQVEAEKKAERKAAAMVRPEEVEKSMIEGLLEDAASV